MDGLAAALATLLAHGGGAPIDRAGKTFGAAELRADGGPTARAIPETSSGNSSNHTPK